ncbi:MAG TPA: glycoside hydrolase family 99-like domain-containing protein, partial [Pyrinomonadaceae bacterium]|nr:glycoside hydrolase family 99-like domain-containing protein [Pyrinomonadaceae bacterium]
MNKKARLLAYYLPQFHPVAENDEWWEKGFTEWTNVTKAKPMFAGHYQPRFPADLGYYDLRVPEVREAQAEMAGNYGVEGFCYYHYWFGGGKQILERPLNEILDLGKPDFPFCLCWANETWQGIAFGETKRTLVEQKYPGREDVRAHFDYLLKAFTDDRYIKVDGKPLFQILTPRNLPDSVEMTDTLRELAHQSGLKGLFIVAGYRNVEGWNAIENGFDAVVSSTLSNAYTPRNRFSIRWFINGILHSKNFVDNTQLQKFFKKYYRVYDYRDVIANVRINGKYDYDYYPCVMPNWDNTPRSGLKGYVVNNSTPELFKEHLTEAIDYVEDYAPEHKIVFIKSWN